ncbi:hypothetical protein [Rhodobacter sp. NSM]|uniref:hypothetical protein n=1 Tax=Rhodobacter sp. NSM TaxID=3457501 RepID=UPI003FCF67B8
MQTQPAARAAEDARPAADLGLEGLMIETVFFDRHGAEARRMSRPLGALVAPFLRRPPASHAAGAAGHP